MKRNLFAVFLAVMLVVAMVFVVAPNAKAETSNVIDAVAGETYEITDSSKIFNLNGQENVTVNIAAGVTLSVVDDGNLNDLTGTSAAKLTVTGEGEIAPIAFDGNFRYLAVQDGNTYSFHPFNLAITQLGLNTLTDSISIGLTYIANDVVKAKLEADGNDYGIKKLTGNTTGPISAKNVYKFGEKNGIQAYYDLAGSLDTDKIDLPNDYQAYIVIDGVEVTNLALTVTPREVLKGLNKANVTCTEAQKGRIDNLIANNARVKNILTSFQAGIKEATLSFDTTDNRQSLSAEQQVWAQNGIKLTNNKAAASSTISDKFNPVWFPSNSSITIEAAGMTQIVFVCYNSTYAGYLKESIDTDSDTTIDQVSSVNDRITITFGAPVDFFSVENLNGLVRLYSMTVTTGTSASCEHMVTTEATCTKEAICLDCDAGCGFADHIGGTATCTEQAKCETCGNGYGDLLPHTENTAATCTEKATCSVCKQPYGDVDSNNHTALSEPTCQSPAHCSACNADIGDTVDHNDSDEDTKCDWCGTEMSETESVWVDAEYSYNFTSAQFVTNETKLLGSVNWTLDGTSLPVTDYGNAHKTRGQQFGSSDAPYTSMTFTSEEFTKVSKITITASVSSGLGDDAAFTVWVGGVQVGANQKLPTYAKAYTFEVPEDTLLTGEVEFRFTQTSTKPIYIKSIIVNYQVIAE